MAGSQIRRSKPSRVENIHLLKTFQFSDPVGGFQYEECESRRFGLVMIRSSHPSCFNNTAPVTLGDRLLIIALVVQLIV